MEAAVAEQAEILKIALRMRGELDDLITRLNPRRHSVDFASVFWEGDKYTFTAAQSQVIRLLWEAMDNLTNEVRQETLLEAASSDSDSIKELFRGHPAWSKLIIPGATKGTYRLAE